MALIGYFLFVAVAVAGVVALLIRLGMNKTANLDQPTALAVLRGQLGRVDPAAALQFGGAHFFRLDSDALYVVHAMGAHGVVRELSKSVLQGLAPDTDGKIVLRFNDGGAPLVLRTDGPAKALDQLRTLLCQQPHG